MSHPVPTRFSDLSDQQVSLMFSTGSWQSPAMGAQARVEACQELENREAEKDGVAARTVVLENISGRTTGYQTGSFIVLNSNVVEDGVFRTTKKDEHGNKHTAVLQVPASNWQVYDTVCHEHEHGVDLDKGTAQTVSYIEDTTDYDLYRIQTDERKAFAVAEAKTNAAMNTVMQALGKEDQNQQDYLDEVQRNSYKEAVARAAQHYNDKDIQKTLDKVCADFEKGLQKDYDSESAKQISQLLNNQMQQNLASVQEANSNVLATEGENAMSTNGNEQETTQGQNQGQDLTGWEADLAALDGESRDGEAQQEGMDEDQSQGQDQDHDDGMGM